MAQSAAPDDIAALPGYGRRLERSDALRLTGEQATQLELLRGDTPEMHYPADARRAAIEGTVLVDLYINEQGQVLEAQVIAESPRGHGFGLAALDLAKTFEFANRFRRRLLLSRSIDFLP